MPGCWSRGRSTAAFPGRPACSCIHQELEQKLGTPDNVNPVWVPNNTTALDKEKAEKLLKLISTLEDDDDVQNVYANFEISDEVMSQLSV